MLRNRHHQTTDLVKKVTTRVNNETERLTTAAKHAADIDIPAGTILCHKGRTADQLVIILEGAAAAAHGITTTFYGPGDILGGFTFLGDAIEPATVSALTTMRLLVLGPSDAMRLLATGPATLDYLRRAAQHEPAQAARQPEDTPVSHELTASHASSSARS